jgi:hypothetical protein
MAPGKFLVALCIWDDNYFWFVFVFAALNCMAPTLLDWHLYLKKLPSPARCNHFTLQLKHAVVSLPFHYSIIWCLDRTLHLVIFKPCCFCELIKYAKRQVLYYMLWACCYTCIKRYKIAEKSLERWILVRFRRDWKGTIKMEVSNIDVSNIYWIVLS